jgi:predicted MFS family arabinose efflux permease
MTTDMTAFNGNERFPINALLALATSAFLALLTEIIPAGTISLISAGMKIPESLTGQFVTAYAVGSLIAAVPLIAATLTWRRKPLLISILGMLLVSNMLTVVGNNLAVIFTVRVLAGVAGGMIWGMLGGYARRMVAVHQRGRAMAVAGVGAPLALSIGVPLGSWVGRHFGWRLSFVALAVLTLLAIIWVIVSVPDFPGQHASKRSSIQQTFKVPGVRPVVAVLICWILAHSILYTFIVPFLAQAGMASQSETVLLVFGLAALGGVWVTGVLIDAHLRRLVLVSLLGFATSAIVLGVAGTFPIAAYFGITLWGVTFGGAASLLNTAGMTAAGHHADVAQAIMVTAWNIAIAGGGVIGGVMLDSVGPSALPWALFALCLVAVPIAWGAHQSGFPRKRHSH